MDNDLWMMLSHLPDSGETVITCDKNPSQFQFLVRRGSQTLDRYTLSKFWVSHKQNCTKVFMLKMGSHIYVEMIFNDFEIICWEILELFTDKVD